MSSVSWASNACIANFNKDGRFHLILSNQGSDNILTSVEGYDITDAIIQSLNDRYAAKK